MPTPKPQQWTLQRLHRPKGAYFQAVWGRPPGRRRTVTLGYVPQEEADLLLANLRLQGARLVTVVLPSGELVSFDDLRAPQGRPLYDDDSIRLAARACGEEPSWEQHFQEVAFREAITTGDLASLPLREFYERIYLPVRRKEVVEGTVRREACVWGKINEVLGDLPVKRIDGITVERFLVSKTSWGGAARRLGMNALRGLLKYAVEVGVLEAMPRLRPVRGGTKRSLPRPVALLPEQVQGILDHASTPSQRALYATAIGQGLRPGEVVALDWSDVDWQRAVLHVRGTKTELSDRLVPITPATASELRPYWESLGRPATGPCFTVRGKPIAKWEVGFAGAAKRAGLDIRVFPYLCRHTFATSCAMSGVPKAAAKEMLGHSEKSEMLEKAYTNPAFSQIAQAMQALTRLGG